MGRDLNVNEGLQTSLFILDEPLGIPKYNVSRKQHAEHGHTNTGWKPDIDVYTITETVEGKFQNLKPDGTPGSGTSERVERRKLTYGKTKTPTHEYYINDVLQAYVGTIPDPTKEIILAGHPVIGNVKDTLKNRIFFEARNIIK